MKRKKILEWEDHKGTKIAQGDRYIFSYQKGVKNYLLLVKSKGGMTVCHMCKTERDCLIISNILNKV